MVILSDKIFPCSLFKLYREGSPQSAGIPRRRRRSGYCCLSRQKSEEKTESYGVKLVCIENVTVFYINEIRIAGSRGL